MHGVDTRIVRTEKLRFLIDPMQEDMDPEEAERRGQMMTLDEGPPPKTLASVSWAIGQSSGWRLRWDLAPWFCHKLPILLDLSAYFFNTLLGGHKRNLSLGVVVTQTVQECQP